MAVMIIGAGFAGLAAAQRLRAAGTPAIVLEDKPYWGGHTYSTERDGFVFDEGPHVSFTKDERVRDLFTAGAGEVNEFQARITNHYQGSWIDHPAQCHLHGLDPDLVSRCIVDFAEEQHRSRTITTYEDWLRAAYGDAFAETFPLAYTRKYWTVEAATMGTDWVGSRMYRPSLDEVVKGALTPARSGDFHYLSTFRYPARGGYQSFMNAFVDERELRLDCAVAGIDVHDRAVTLADGSTVGYDTLISTMPLPELVAAVTPDQVPAAVREAAGRLLCTSLVLVDVAVNRPDLADHHWFYVYDGDVSFARGHFPHMLAAANAPSGHGSIQVEVYHSTHRPLTCDPSVLPERVVDELVRIGVLAGRSEVLWARHREVRYANVVFDHHRSSALAVVKPWVEGHGIALAGRYGEWGYHWTDDAVRSGWAAADRVLADVA